MSRNGVARSWPPWTIRISPPCSTTKSRPEPSAAFAIPSGAVSPPTTSSKPTVTRFGSNRAVGDPDGPDAPGGTLPAGTEATDDDGADADPVAAWDAVGGADGVADR